MLCSCGSPHQCMCYENLYSPYPTQSTMYPHTPAPFLYSYPYPSASSTFPSNYATPTPARTQASLSVFENVFPANYSQEGSRAESPAFRVALANTTTSVVNWATPENPQSRSASNKRKQGSSAGNSGTSKRQNTSGTPAASISLPESTVSSASPASLATPSNQSNASHPAVPGAGPQLAIPGSHTPDASDQFVQSRGPSSSLGTLFESAAGPNHATATDIYYFVRGLKSAEYPAVAPSKEKQSLERPNMKEYSHLGCILCPFDVKWTTWKNVGGQSNTIRHHFKKEHFKTWADVVILKKLKGWREILRDSRRGEPAQRESFNLEGFYDRLTKWVAVDDQSLDVVDCPELRNLFLFIGEQLNDEDIPHRTKLSELITKAFKREYAKMINEIQHSEGRVSFTSDIWSRHTLQSFMGVTGHFMVRKGKRLEMHSELVAFRHLEGSHCPSSL
ncbi:hypothetical protein CPB84DRAFT_1777550 [Gymnopilus junonius]|uniref:Uncharacterized protein n=1 Tax=Gymnopilus junonius TaxID=109634 RepID=A0A9P5NRJ8_GYMJU|nr:hypothetical protein CPB84DRAFT_1777550 [Gymnopilus junonius]